MWPHIDVAIRVGDVTGAALVRRRLAASPRIVCASPDYLARRGVPLRPPDLLENNCLTFRSEQTQPTWRFLEGQRLTELRVGGSLRSEHGDVLREAALGGLGIVLLPAWSVGEDLLAGRLTGLLLEHEATPFGFDPDLYVITHRARHRARHRALKVRLFLEFLHEAFVAKRDWARDRSLAGDEPPPASRRGGSRSCGPAPRGPDEQGDDGADQSFGLP